MRAYRVDGRSRPAYDPAMMVALLLYAYARGIRSSRVIERACEEDVAFRVLAAQQRPDHATIARFVERHQDAIAGLFGEVLTLCAQQRAGEGRRDRRRRHEAAGQREPQREPSTTSSSRARSSRRRKAIDAAEDELYGEARGDELPRGVRDRRKAAAAGCARPSSAWRPSARRTRSRCRAAARKRLKEAKRRLEEELWTEMRANRAYEAYRARGRDEGRPPLRPAHRSPTRRPRRRRARSTSPTPTHTSSRACAGSCRATTPKPSPTSTRS